MTASKEAPLELDHGLSGDGLAWDKMHGLLPAIIQHARSGVVLMLGYMDRDALNASLATRRVTFYSRSRQRPWTKGETSGHYLDIVGITADCDQDALLVRALPRGPVCHTGALDCFSPEAGDPPLAFLTVLEDLLPARIAAGEAQSYTARLAASGIARIAQKVGEEGVEVALAAVTADAPALTGEAADLVYHLLVLLHARGLALTDVSTELARRHAAPKPAP